MSLRKSVSQSLSQSVTGQSDAEGPQCELDVVEKINQSVSQVSQSV